MKKRLIVICCIVCAFLITSIIVITADNFQFIAYRVDYSILVNGEHVNFRSPLIRTENRVYVSLRDISEFLGYEVIWHGESNQISLRNEVYRQQFYHSFYGFLPSGTKYEFWGEDKGVFNFNEFLERNQPLLPSSPGHEFDTKIFAQTPSEAAELGQFYLQLRTVLPREHIEGVSETIIVRYCAEIDSWVLKEDLPVDTVIFGATGTLTINRRDGSINRRAVRWHDGDRMISTN